MLTFHGSARPGLASSGRRKTASPAAAARIVLTHPRMRTYVSSSRWYCGGCHDLRVTKMSPFISTSIHATA